MIGFHFTKYDPSREGKSKFDQLLDIFMQLLTYTSGDVGEALQWMNQLDKEYELTDDEYGMGDFIDELKGQRIYRRKQANRRHQDQLQNRTGHPEKIPGRNLRKTKKNKIRRS